MKWYGLKKDGQQVAIDHEDFMKWAHDNDQQFQVGWSDHHTTFEGTRVVRSVDGTPLPDVARKAGWNDIAEQLERAGIR